MNKLIVLLLLLLVACQPVESPAPLPPPESTDPAAFPAGTVVDLTYAFDEETVYWPTADGFELTVDAHGMTEGGYWYEANSFRSAEHGGTHLDAPVHFAEGKWTTDQIPLERLMGPAILIDVSAQASEDPDYQVTQADFEAWETDNGPMPDDIIVLLRTGFGAFWPDRVRYMGTDERGAEAVAKLHFPGLHPDAARWLVDNRSIKAIGLDTPSIDYGQSSLFESHQTLFAANIPAFENVAHLDQLPLKDFTVIALPMKIAKGSGGPLRIVAVVP
ncbi:MAG TPA: cyclase family protein [Rhodothermales bacterium]|nr:cyclase family protein [Rhodothermales bacterium]